MKLFEDTESTELSITPLIDVVFILLIFFMVSTSFVGKHGLKIKLPKAETSSVTSENKALDISISQDGIISINGSKTNIENIKKYAKINKTKSAKLSADEKVQHGLVIKIMDELRKSGIFQISIETRIK